MLHDIGGTLEGDQLLSTFRRWFDKFRLSWQETDTLTAVNLKKTVFLCCQTLFEMLEEQSPDDGYPRNIQKNLQIYSTRIKDAGIAIRHSRGYIISILQGLEMGWRGMKWCVHSQEIVKMGQFRLKIIKIKVSTFWMSGKSTDSRRRPMPAFSPVGFKQYLAALAAKYSKKCGF